MIRPPHQYALTGIVLGLGAPIGALFFRIILAPDAAATAWAYEWEVAAYYYVYMAVGTTVAFGVFGYVLGRRNEDLGNLSVTDGLTGLYNHRYLQEQLAREIQRSDRYQTPLTCLMTDIDDFKKVNDQHGHLFGDLALRTIADLVQTSVRRTDVVGRYGGEELLVIMPQTDEASALPLAERIVNTVADHAFKTDASETVHITLSIGLATYPDPDRGIKTQSALLSAADQAMYKAKLSGKNRAIVWRP
jgi:diguanylate cyclase (GGDEF)-like protein